MAPAPASGPLPKFGEWNANNMASAEDYTAIFNKVKSQKKAAANGASGKPMPVYRKKKDQKCQHNPQEKKRVCCFYAA